MTGRESAGEAVLTSVLKRWRQFWFDPEPAYVLGLVRMAFGALALAWTLALLPDLLDLFGEQAAVSRQPLADAGLGVFDFWHTNPAVVAAWIVLLIACAALTVGWHSRFAAVVVFVLIRSFMTRTPAVFNYGDAVIGIEALLLALSSCGAALSLDQRRRTGTFWSAQTRAPWVVRLLQVQLSLIYVSTFAAKLAGKTWMDGSAVSYAWQLAARWATIPVPDGMASNPFLVNVATWGTMLIEIAIAILVWNPHWRLRVLLAGVVLHLAIMINMSVGFFSVAMFVLYLSFVPWQVAERMPEVVRTIWDRLRRRADAGSKERTPVRQEPPSEENLMSSNAADASRETPAFLPEPPPTRTTEPTAG